MEKSNTLRFQGSHSVRIMSLGGFIGLASQKHVKNFTQIQICSDHMREFQTWELIRRSVLQKHHDSLDCCKKLC